MAVLHNDGKRTQRRPSLKGGVMLDVANGGERARAWPKKRGKNLPEKTMKQMEFFRQVMFASKLASPDQMIGWEQATKGTPLLTRDMFLMMWSNRLCSITLPDGHTMYPQVAISDVSQSLDVISDAPGTLLRRGAEQWEPFILPDTSLKACFVQRAGGQTGAGSNVFSAAIWTSAPFDPAGMWSAGSPTRFTAPADGTILCIANASANFGTLAQLNLAIATNGNVNWRTRPPKATAGGDVLLNVAGAQRVASGDYVEIYIASDVAAQSWGGLFAFALFIPDPL